MALPISYRLKSAKDFEYVFQKGKTVRGSFLLVKLIKNRFAHSRFGFIVSSKLATKAVQRNLIRRKLANAIQQYTPSLAGSYDIVVLVRNLPKEEDLLAKELINVLKELKL